MERQMHLSQGSYYVPNRHARSRGSFSDHEPGLWRAVITQALMDAASRSSKSDAQRLRSDALSWLLSDADDFTAVCDNAGLDPDYVRSRARTALRRNCEWRLQAGLGWRTRARQQAALASVE
jgi:elongation factor P hydroxylase